MSKSRAPDTPDLPVSAIDGLSIGCAAADVRQSGRADRDDVVLFALSEATRASVVLTNNAFAAAPVRIVRGLRAEAGAPRALLINSGNANAGTGDAGINAAIDTCKAVAQAVQIPGDADQSWRHVWPFSTGVIGQALPVDRMQVGIDAAAAALGDADNAAWQRAARAIMTTDTVPKLVSRSVTVADGTDISLTGIAKGAGMIRPDMATMLAFVATDAAISQDALDRLLARACDASFHRISVDGDTSTNDAAVLIATGTAGNAVIETATADYAAVAEALDALSADLARAIVRDAEGASKFVTVRVTGGRTTDEARQVGLTVAASPLVKTAWFASDANWGRILAAVGRSGIEGLQMGHVSLRAYGPGGPGGPDGQNGSPSATMIERGEPAAEYSEAAGAAVFALPEFTVDIDLGRGDRAAEIWTCDLGHEYVRINAEYRS